MTTDLEKGRNQPAPLAYSPREFCAATGLSRATLFRMMRAGQIPFAKARRRTLIPAASVEALIAGEF